MAGTASARWLLDMVFGADVVAALLEGVQTKGGDFTGVAPLLVGPSAKPYLRAAARRAFVTACDTGLAGAVGLLLKTGAIDPNTESEYVVVVLPCAACSLLGWPTTPRVLLCPLSCPCPPCR